MMKISTMALRGASGAEYLFNVHPIDTNWRDRIGAVFVELYTYPQGQEEICIGETEDMKKRNAKWYVSGRVTKGAANYIGVCVDFSASNRAAVTKDLVLALKHRRRALKVAQS